MTEQPAPVSNERVDAFTLVIDDLEDRREHGINTYGTALQAFNGRDTGQDAYEEALDLAVYLRTLRTEIHEICDAARKLVDTASPASRSNEVLVDFKAVEKLEKLLEACGR